MHAALTFLTPSSPMSLIPGGVGNSLSANKGFHSEVAISSSCGGDECRMT